MSKYAPRNGIEALAERYGVVSPKRIPTSLRLVFSKKMRAHAVFRDNSFLQVTWTVTGIHVYTTNDRFRQQFTPFEEYALPLEPRCTLYSIVPHEDETKLLFFLIAMRPKSVHRI